MVTQVLCTLSFEFNMGDFMTVLAVYIEAVKYELG